MQNNNDNGTMYTFQESGTGNLLLKTKDMSVISGIVPSHTIAETEKIIIKGVSYNVVGFEIDISAVAQFLILLPAQCKLNEMIYTEFTLLFICKKVLIH